MTDDVVLTGGSGFIGSYLKRHLVAQGINPTEITRTSVIGPQGLHHHNNDSSAIAEALVGLSEPVLIHLAGLFVSRHEPRDILPLVQANIGFSALVFDSFHRAGYKAVLNAGTSWQFNAEGHPAAANLYAATKIAGQAVLDYYVHSEAMSAITLVIYDTYGPGDRRPKLIPLLRKTWLEGAELKMTSGVQPVNFTHVCDVVEAILQAAKNVRGLEPRCHDRAAIRSHKDISVRELISTIRSHVAPDIQVELGAVADGAAPRDLCVSIPPVNGWSEKISLVEGMKGVFQREER